MYDEPVTLLTNMAAFAQNAVRSAMGATARKTPRICVSMRSAWTDRTSR
jgi:hypothetical protein